MKSLQEIRESKIGSLRRLKTAFDATSFASRPSSPPPTPFWLDPGGNPCSVTPFEVFSDTNIRADPSTEPFQPASPGPTRWMIGPDGWSDQMDDQTRWIIGPYWWSDQMDDRIGWIIGLDGWSDCLDDGTRWMIRQDEWWEIIRPDGMISQGWLDGRVWLDGRNWSDWWVWFKVLTDS